VRRLERSRRGQKKEEASATLNPLTTATPVQAQRQSRTTPQKPCELSVVMPCLNEAETLRSCIKRAQETLRIHKIAGEIIVADNGSTDGSQEIARQCGVRVINIAERGYGSALMGGIAAARGEFIVMGDADASYDFAEIPLFLKKLHAGADLVMGNRFKGILHKGAMPFMHRHIGNPILTKVSRLFFGCPIGDAHCGLRAFRKDAYERMQLTATGMEFASEMIVKSTLKGMHIAEVPTSLRPDGRSRAPHLRRWRDGWRHLRFMLLFSPRWLFFIPGVFLFAAATGLFLWLLPQSRFIGSIELGIHTLLVSGMVIMLGYQLITFAVFARMFASVHGFHPRRSLLPARIIKHCTLERGILLGMGMTLGGIAILAYASWQWRNVGFGNLDPTVTMRQVIPATLLFILGLQTIFASFFLNIPGIQKGA